MVSPAMIAAIVTLLLLPSVSSDERTELIVKWFRSRRPDLVRFPVVNLGDSDLEGMGFLVERKESKVASFIGLDLRPFKAVLANQQANPIEYAAMAAAAMKEPPDTKECLPYARRRRILLFRAASDALKNADQAAFSNIATYLGRGTPDLFRQVKDDLAFFAVRDAILKFSDTSASKEDRVAALKAVEQKYPQSQQSDTIRKLLRALERSGERLPRGEDTISRLVEALTKQTGSYPLQMRPTFSIFIDKEAPAGRLAKLGNMAVPALVEAIGDDSPTCAVVASEEDELPRVLRVGECAQLILERIIDRRFSNRHRIRTKQGRSWSPSAVTAEVQSWYLMRQRDKTDAREQ